MQNTRLAEASHALAESLGAISELAVRLNRIHDIDGIAASIQRGLATARHLALG